MPLPVGPLIAAGGAIAGAGIGAASTGAQNRRSRQWSERMYNRQFQDNITFWNMQNDYNSPQAQMKRLQEAGLNPNLVYGGGSAANQASPIKTPDVQAPQFRPIDADLGSVLSSYFDTEIKQAQVDNLRADNTVKLEQAALIAAQTANTATNTEQSRFNLGLDTELREVSAEARRENLRQLKANTNYTLSENERAAAMNASNLKEAAERILSMRATRANTYAERRRIEAQIKNLDFDTELKRLDAELKQLGISWDDNIFMRVLGRLLGPYIKPGNLFKDVFK